MSNADNGEIMVVMQLVMSGLLGWALLVDADTVGSTAIAGHRHQFLVGSMCSAAVFTV